MVAEISEQYCTDKIDQAVSSLISVLPSKDGLVRKTVRQSLVAIGEAAVQPLTDALHDRNKNVRWEAAKALSEIGSPSCAAGLVVAMHDEDFGVRWLAAEGLIGLGRNGLKPLLEALIDDPDSAWVREGAHHVLKVLSDKGLHDLLQPLMIDLESFSKKGDVVPAARSVLSRLESENQEDQREAADRAQEWSE